MHRGPNACDKKSLDGVGGFCNLPRAEDRQVTKLRLEIFALAMSPNRWFRTSAIALVALCTSCGTDRDSTMPEPADNRLPVTRIAENEPTMSFNDVELSLELISRDMRGLPKEIRITFRNTSSKRGCLVLPRPVVEGDDYGASLPCLCVGMRETGDDDLIRAEPIFLYAKPRGQSAGPREGVYLDAGAQIARKYDLSSFCLIGHGIAPKPNANFSTCYKTGDQESELRACVITDWTNLTRINSNPILVRTSEADFSVHLKLEDDCFRGIPGVESAEQVAASDRGGE